MLDASETIEVFYLYTDQDEDLQRQLDNHLSFLRGEGLIAPWHKRLITPGMNRTEALDQHLNAASIILLLVSVDFMASGYCYGIEMQRAMERHNAGEAHIIPILLRPVENWQDTQFGKLQVLPRNGTPVTSWFNREDAFVDIAQGIRETLREVQNLVVSIPATMLSHTRNIPHKEAESLTPPKTTKSHEESLSAQKEAQGKTHHSASAVQNPPEQISRPASDPQQVTSVHTFTDREETTMDAGPFTVLIHQTINILTSYIRYQAGGASTPEVSDVYQQCRDMYTAVLTQFNRETDGGRANRVLENFIRDPEEYGENIQRKLASLLQANPDFARKLRSVVSLPLFIGRDQELQEYTEFLKDDAHWIWIITGLEGSGKTQLLDQMKKKTDQVKKKILSDISVIKLDFAFLQQQYGSSTAERRSIEALECLRKLADQLKAACDQQHYENFETDLRNAYDEGPHHINIFIEQILNANTNAKASNNNLEIKTFIEEYVKNAQKGKRLRITFAFHKLMESFKPNHLVLLLDTCELLMESVNVEVREWLLHDILFPLYDSMRQRQEPKQCHVVMMSTVALPLQGSNDRKQSSLEPLDKNLVKQHLERIGVNDSELRCQFYDITDGHAKCVDILCKLWLQWEQEGRQIADAETLIKFQKAFNEKAEREFVNKHILDKLPKMPQSPLYNWTRYGILLRSFNRRLLDAVFPDLLGILSTERAQMWFDQFTTLSYIRHLGDDNYGIHELLRRVLGYSIRIKEPNLWREYHKCAMDFFEDDINPLILPRSPDWHYHSLAFHFVARANRGLDKYYWDEGAGKFYWEKTLASLKEERITLTPLLEAARDKTLMLTWVASAAQREAQQYEQTGS